MAHASPAVVEVPDNVHRRRWWALAVLSLSLVMIVMDNTILNVALPHLSENLNATTSQLQWIVDAYTIVFAGLLLTLGALGDRLGRRKALVAGLVVFAAGSFAATFATTATWLIVSRGAMGVGGALIMPSTLSILANVFRDPKERAKAISVWSAASGIGIVVGPLLGGYLLNHFAWSSVFWVNVPVALLMLGATLFIVPESKAADAPRTDVPGVLLSTGGIVALLWGIIQAPEHGWTNGSILLAFAAAVVALVGFVAWELHTPQPMLDVRFFQNRRFSAANGAVTLAMFGMFGSLFLLSQFLQFVQGHDALAAGVRMTPFAIGLAAGAPIGNLLDRRIGTKLTVTLGLTVTAIGLYSFTSLDSSSSFTPMLISMLIMSIGMGTVFGPATESVMGSLPPERAGVGSAINDTTRELGGALGVAVIGSAMSSIFTGQMASAVGGLGLPAPAREAAERSLAGGLAVARQIGGEGGQLIANAARSAFVDGMHRGVTIGALAVLAGAAAALAFLPARARATSVRVVTPGLDQTDDDAFTTDELPLGLSA